MCADRYDFYYRQRVLEDELDSAFTGLEDAVWAALADTGICRDDSQPAVFGGIMSGFTTTYSSGLDMSVGVGVGYDSLGKRVALSAPIAVSVSNEGDTDIGEGGTADGSLASPSEGYERWVSIFIVYDRYLDPAQLRYDGYNSPVYFSRAESFHFSLVAGTEKTIGTLLTSDKPARESNKLLITDVRIKTVSSVVQYVSHDQLRREWFINLTATNLPNKTIQQGLIREAMQDMLEMYNEHVRHNAQGGTYDRHDALDIDFTGTKNWADGTGGMGYGTAIVAADAINGIVQDLASDGGGADPISGAERVGAPVVGGLLATPAAAATTLNAGSIHEQLETLLVAVNGRVFRGGDTGITGALAPNATGVDLGTTGARWDALLQDLNISGSITGNLYPAVTNTQAFGSSGLRWGPTYLYSLDVASDIVGSGGFLLQGTGTMDVEGALTAHNITPYTRTDVPYLVNLLHATTEMTGSSTAIYSCLSDGPLWDLTRVSAPDACFLRVYIDDFPEGATITAIAIDSTCAVQGATGATVTVYRSTWGGYTAPIWTRYIMNSSGPDTNLPNTNGVRAVIYHVCNQNNTGLTARTCDLAGSTPGGDMISLLIEPATGAGGRLLVHAIVLELTHAQSGKWYKVLT